jgi:hypothetical protein
MYMACDTITVTGAGTSAVDGTYNKVSSTQWNDEEGVYRIIVDSAGGAGLYVWILNAISGGPPIYSSTLSTSDCPAGLTLSPVTGSSPSPTITAVASAPTFGLPADVVALITSRFGTVANFLRLRNQGQV